MYEWEILLFQEEEIDLLFTNSEDDELQQNGKYLIFFVENLKMLFFIEENDIDIV